MNRMLAMMFVIPVVVITSGITCYSQICGCDSTPSENDLEPNWGIVSLNPFTQAMPDPTYIVYNFAVSPDERWIAYTAGWDGNPSSLQLKDISSGRVTEVSRTGHSPQWSPNGQMLQFRDYTLSGLRLYRPISGEHFSLLDQCDSHRVCADKVLWGADNNLYFANCFGIAQGSQPGYYRFLIDFSLKRGCLALERVSSDTTATAFALPNWTLDWLLDSYKYWEVPGMMYEDTDTVGGFSIVHSFDWTSHRRIVTYALRSLTGGQMGMWRMRGNSWGHSLLANDYATAVYPSV